MAMFKMVAREQLRLLYTILLMGSLFRLFPADPANACGADLYVHVVLAHHHLILTVFAAAMLLLLVLAAVNCAEAHSIAAARAAAKDLDAKHEAAVAARKGVGCIAARWHRASVRALLLVAVALSFAASFFAVVSTEVGYLYATGCDAGHAGYGTGSPAGVVMLVAAVTLVHGCGARVAVCDN